MRMTLHPPTFETSITRNVAALAAILPEVKMETLSYPIGNPRAENKRLAARRYRACRGGGQTFNQSKLDLSLVSAFFLEQSRTTRTRLRASSIKPVLTTVG